MKECNEREIVNIQSVACDTILRASVLLSCNNLLRLLASRQDLCLTNPATGNSLPNNSLPGLKKSKSHKGSI
jgi:hypothetical protein